MPGRNEKLEGGGEIHYISLFPAICHFSKQKFGG